MGKIIKIFAVCMLMGMSAVGCAPRYPTTTVSTLDSRPTLSFPGAPAGAIVLIDGVTMGEAARFNGKPGILPVQPGTHEVAVMLGGTEVSRQTVFVESEHKVINVNYTGSTND